MKPTKNAKKLSVIAVVALSIFSSTLSIAASFLPMSNGLTELVVEDICVEGIVNIVDEYEPSTHICITHDHNVEVTDDDLDPLQIFSTRDDSKESIPTCDTNMYTCEPYQLTVYDENNTPYKVPAFNTRSDQYRLQLDCKTSDRGLRYLDVNGSKYYAVAMANAYGNTIGDAWTVTLVNGYSFNVIMGDFKHPIRYDPLDLGDPLLNYDGEYTINVCEFIVDWDVLPAEVKQYGTLSCLEEFGGIFGDSANMERITYIGRVWS